MAINIFSIMALKIVIYCLPGIFDKLPQQTL